jgi:hypothetical protein
MAEKSRRRLLAAGLVIISAVVFGVGINWGLPSHDIDPILFGTGDQAATNALNSYHLTGVGIEQLAGKWNDNSNVGADVEEHPIMDRSGPVTLLENVHELTADQIVAQGDETLAKLVARSDAADAAYGRARLGSNEAAADKAREAAAAAQLKVHRYVEKYNREHFGDQSAVIARDDVSRARILRRYRLYSYQPDEMISFRALAMMHPDKRDFDPKLYQYGGLWIYPLGAILKVGSIVGYATVTGDTTYYYDSPEVFGRFYVLARAYSAAWGIVAVLAIFAIVRRVSGNDLLAFLAAICFMCMPVVLDLAHEAKPHLAGVALLLLAVLGAGKYAETGRIKWLIWTAVACGACAGMVLSGLVALVILPVMSVLHRDRTGRFLAVCVVGTVIVGGVYFVANPYVAIHLTGDRTVLESNLANSRAMYPQSPNVGHAIALLAIGMGWPLAILGVLAAVVLLIRRAPSLQHIGWLIAVPAAIILIDFVIFADEKPGEYARFAIFVDTGLMLAVFFVIGRLHQRPSPLPSPGVPGEGERGGVAGEGGRCSLLQVVAGLVLIAIAAVHSAAYERGFFADATDDNSRMAAAQRIDGLLPAGLSIGNLYIMAEPAPYDLPPVNLFRWKIILLPIGDGDAAGLPPGVLVKPVNSTPVFDPQSAPISWAGKAFDVVQVGGK